MKNIYKLGMVGLFVVLIVPNLVFASWWNPLSWSIWNIFRPTPHIQQVQIATTTAPTAIVTTTEKADTKVVSTKKPVVDSTQKEDCTIKQEVSNKDSCYLNLARLNNDANICNNISNDSGGGIKRACFSSFPTYKPYKLVSGGIPILLIDKDSSQMKSDITVTIKNEAVTPFITKVAIYNCKATDGINIIPMEITEGYEFPEKALSIGQEVVIDFKINDYLGNEKCIYNNTGIKTCERPLEKAKSIISCDFSIATDNSQITGGWGEFFQTLVF